MTHAPDWRELDVVAFDRDAAGCQLALEIPAAELAGVMPGDDAGTMPLGLWDA